MLFMDPGYANIKHFQHVCCSASSTDTLLFVTIMTNLDPNQAAAAPQPATVSAQTHQIESSKQFEQLVTTP